MRCSYLFISLLLLGGLTACGSEDSLVPPAFSEIKVNGNLDTTIPVNVSTVPITGKIDNIAAKVVANSTATGEKTVEVKPDGSWSFTFETLTVGANTVTFTATDQRGNINQLYLTVTYDSPPFVITDGVKLGTNSTILIVTFNESLLETSLATASFAVDGIQVAGVSFDPLKPTEVTLTLSAAVETGVQHQLTCSGVTDLVGNSIAAAPFLFVITTPIP